MLKDPSWTEKMELNWDDEDGTGRKRKLSSSDVTHITVKYLGRTDDATRYLRQMMRLSHAHPSRHHRVGQSRRRDFPFAGGSAVCFTSSVAQTTAAFSASSSSIQHQAHPRLSLVCFVANSKTIRSDLIAPFSEIIVFSKHRHHACPQHRDVRQPHLLPLPLPPFSVNIASQASRLCRMLTDHLQYSTEDFNKVIKENPAVVVDWFATWCAPCKAIAPKLVEYVSPFPPSGLFLCLPDSFVPATPTRSSSRTSTLPKLTSTFSTNLLSNTTSLLCPPSTSSRTARR